MLALTAFFFLICAAVLLLQTTVAVTGEGCTVYTEGGVGARTVREKLNAVLGLADTTGTQNGSSVMDGRININAATVEELCTLPGIGETLASRIVRYRTYNGPFEDVSHIRDVTAIGDGLYAKIADFIYAGS